MFTFARKPAIARTRAPAPESGRIASAPAKVPSYHLPFRLLPAASSADGAPAHHAFSKTKQQGLQAKLTINEPGDVYEQEADRVADQVMAVSSRAAVASTPPRIQRLASQPVGQTDAAPASVDRVLASPGKPLEPSLRQDMDQRFGHDFSQVRTHTGTAAEESAEDVNAQAYTVGHDIVFGRGRFAQGTHEGQRLIAHELTHVVQQSGADGVSVGRSAQRLIQRTPACPDRRDSGEVTKSKSPTGVLPNDTVFEATQERLLVQDFGVDQESVPLSMTQSDDWRRMMSMILGDPMTRFAVLGFTDCMGTEAGNQGLRDRRADAVLKAMPPEAQAKVFAKGWGGNQTYLFPNDTAENRARNRMVLVGLLRSRADSCDALTKASTIDQFIFLVSCLEKRLGLTNATDAPKTLSLLRQLFFGNASWSTQRNRSNIWDDIITDRPWSAGDDPTPKLGAKLLSALQASKDVRFDNSASSKGIEVSHLLTGLDALMNPKVALIRAAGLVFVDTEVDNHAIATWAGDVASAAANYTICVDHLKFAASYDDFFKSLAEDADLEGDIDAYAVWAAMNSGLPSTQVALQLNLPVSELLMRYYRLKAGPTGRGQAGRIAIFANYYGADVKGRRMQNRLAFQQNIYPTVAKLAVLFLLKQIKEGLSGNLDGLGDCAGGKPPRTGQQEIRVYALLQRVHEVSLEMVERFTIWLEKRL